MISIALFGDASKYLLDKNYALIKYKSVILYNDTKKREFEFSNDNYIQHAVDVNGDLKLYPSILRNGEMVARTSVIIYLYDQLDH